MFIMIPTMVLSGFIFPIESMPPAIQTLTYLIPLRYALVVLRGAFVKGSGFADLAGPLLGSGGLRRRWSSGPPSSPCADGCRSEGAAMTTGQRAGGHAS